MRNIVWIQILLMGFFVGGCTEPLESDDSIDQLSEDALRTLLTETAQKMDAVLTPQPLCNVKTANDIGGMIPSGLITEEMCQQDVTDCMTAITNAGGTVSVTAAWFETKVLGTYDSGTYQPGMFNCDVLVVDYIECMDAQIEIVKNADLNFSCTVLDEIPHLIPDADPIPCERVKANCNSDIYFYFPQLLTGI